MKVIKSHRIVMFDVDDTLVLWDWRAAGANTDQLIDIHNPGSEHVEHVLPHLRHIELMRQFKARGHTVVVWSQGGWAWAESVVKALGIEDLVDIVMDKPNWYVDDLHASAWMREPIYLDTSDSSKDKRWGNTEGNIK